ncbi:MAG: 2'-5' RNA ligase family protein [Chloroflexi bacterium]|nr:2'-5' RNA ligase family protein [Chloroflexota bacterium]
MHGLVSLLPQPFYHEVELLWDELERECGLVGMRQSPFPHFSWTASESVSESALQAALSRLARQIKPFAISTAGVGIFPGEKPVVFIRAVKSPALFSLHEAILAAVREPLGGALNPLYEPDVWVPHITLASEDVTEENLGAVVRLLAGRDLHWKMQIDNLAFILHHPGNSGEMKFVQRLQA